MTRAVELAQVASLGVSEAFKNRIINGGMVLDQRNAGASVTPTSGGTFSVDRWSTVLTQASKYSVQQNAGSVTPPVGFTNYLGITSLSAYSVLTGDTFAVQQAIEGFNTSDLAWGTAQAKTVCLSFQVYSSLTGTFGGALTNSAANRSYPFSYTVSSANTWTSISVTIAGDTSGTWLTTNGIGIVVRFGLGSGATFSGTAGAWAAGNFVQPTSTTSVVGTNGATFYITGVQLEVGSSATSFEYRPYGTELQLAQRYFCKSSSTNVVAVNNTSYLTTGAFTSGVVSTYATNAGYINWIKYPVTMRTEAATVTYINTSLPSPGTSGQLTVYNGSAWINTNTIATQSSTTEGFNASISFSGTAYMYYGAWTASAEL
jgi:hypothetical protein